MKAIEIIRSVLDLIDKLECSSVNSEPEDQIQTGVDTNRFKHIFAMLSAERSRDKMYSNSPVEIIASLDSVTKDAGGGWNGPKNPSDMRSDSVSLYPIYRENKE